MKALKRKEIVEKIRKLEKVTGSDMAFKEEDLDDDFDPEAYDKRMQEVFENYDTTAADPDEEKPEWSDMSGLATNSIIFCFLFVKKSLICLEGKSMTPHRGNTVLFRSSQQLPRLRLGPLKGFLS